MGIQSPLSANNTSTPTPAIVVPELRGGRFIYDSQGTPVVRRGRWADVYAFQRDDGQVQALRVWRDGGHAIATSYATVHDYFEHRHVPGLARFCCHMRGANLSGMSEVAPVVVMDWVQGLTLDAWVAEQINYNKLDAIARVAALWHELTKGLAQHGVVHGDLEPGNVFVEPSGRLTLVDYDCMAVPTTFSEPTLEAGTPPYQHPGRGMHTQMFAGLDNFSALVIYAALRALAADPNLLQSYPAGGNRGRLLFSADDFAGREDSILLKDLFASPDDGVRDLAHNLRALAHGNLHDVPPIDEVLLWGHSLESLLARRDFDLAVQLVGRLGAQEHIDWRLLPAIDDAHRHVAARQALEIAVDSGDVAKVESTYNESLSADYPAAAAVAYRAQRMLEAAHAQRLLDEAVAAKRWTEFERLWLLYGTSAAPSAAERHRRLFDALQAAKRLEAMLDDPASDEQTTASQWRSLFGDGEPPLADQLQSTYERRRLRQRYFTQIVELLGAMREAPTFAADQQLRKLWKEAEPLGDTRLETLRGHYRLAKQRMKRMRWLNSLAQSPTLNGEQQIASCLRYLPATYHEKLPGRIQVARQRLEAVRILESAALEPISDRRLLDAWSAVVSAKGQALVSAERTNRVSLAQRRVALLSELEALGSLTPHERDRRVMELWDDSLLAGCAEAAPVRWMREDATARDDAIAALAGALELGDAELIAAARNDVCLRDFPLPEALNARLSAYDELAVQARNERRHALAQAVLNHDLTRFCDLFDRELVADLCRHLPHHERIVSDWVEREILPQSKPGLDGEAETGLRWTGSRHCQARWTWPASTITDRCVLAVLREAPRRHETPGDLSPLYSIDVSHHVGSNVTPTVELPFEPEWLAAGVFVWTVVDLGYQSFYSEPLCFGPLRPPDQ
ncbi:MAG TPA: AarF/UbiB family protein [Pirellulales bacterium]|nr:AarF/UbiB family protein [Pirellulales bacterium]